MQKFEVHRTPSKAGARGDCRWSQRLHGISTPKEPLHARRWNRCFVQELLACDGFTLWSMKSPMSRAVLIKSSDRPPSDSTTNGMNVTPTEQQGCRWAASFLWVPTWRAWPGVKADSSTMDCWSGEITSSLPSALCWTFPPLVCTLNQYGWPRTFDWPPETSLVDLHAR